MLRRDSLVLGLVIPFPLIFVVIGAGGTFLIWRKQAPEAEKPIAAGALRKSRKGKGKSRYAVAALFAVFAVVGGALLYPLGIKPIAKTIAAESWVTTPCRVLRAEVRSHDSDDGTTYSVYILYQYEFQGQTYKSDRYEFLGGSSSGYQGKARVVATYEAACESHLLRESGRSVRGRAQTGLPCETAAGPAPAVFPAHRCRRSGSGAARQAGHER